MNSRLHEVNFLFLVYDLHTSPPTELGQLQCKNIKTGEYKNSNKSLISTQSPVEMLGSQDAIVHPKSAIFLTATVDVMGAAIFMTTAAQLSLTYVHQVSQINV